MIFINDNWLFFHPDPDVSYQSQALGRYDFVRALALKNAKVISKVLLAFQGSKTCTSRNGKAHYCKFFCNSATVQF